jgi:ankyrin repeat protein
MYLLGHENVDVNIKGRSGYTLLHMACKKARKLSVDVFKLLIETKGFDVNARDNRDNTPLHHALCNFNLNYGGDVNVWAYLINQKNINVNIKDSNGHTLLHLACIYDIPDLYDFMDPQDDYMDSEDDFTDSEGNLDNHRETKAESFLCQIVEILAERCIKQVLDETTP